MCRFEGPRPETAGGRPSSVGQRFHRPSAYLVASWVEALRRARRWSRCSDEGQALYSTPSPRAMDGTVEGASGRRATRVCTARPPTRRSHIAAARRRSARRRARRHAIDHTEDVSTGSAGCARSNWRPNTKVRDSEFLCGQAPPAFCRPTTRPSWTTSAPDSGHSPGGAIAPPRLVPQREFYADLGAPPTHATPPALESEPALHTEAGHHPRVARPPRGTSARVTRPRAAVNRGRRPEASPRLRDRGTRDEVRRRRLLVLRGVRGRQGATGEVRASRRRHPRAASARWTEFGHMEHRGLDLPTWDRWLHDITSSINLGPAPRARRTSTTSSASSTPSTTTWLLRLRVTRRPADRALVARRFYRSGLLQRPGVVHRRGVRR